MTAHLQTPAERAEFRGAVWREYARPASSRPLRAVDYLNWLAALEERRLAEAPDTDFETFIAALYLHPTLQEPTPQ